MGEDFDFLPNIPSPGDGSMAACRSGIARTNSVASSLTVDSSDDFSPSNADVTSDPYVEWTNERHSSYLDSLEASFVKQLHSSLGLLGWRSQGNAHVTNSSHKMPAHTRHSSQQFSVLRNGCWQRVSFERNQPLLDRVVDSQVLIDSPWISRLRSAGNHHMSTSSDFQKQVEGSQSARNSTSSNGLARYSEKRRVGHACHQDVVGSSTEVSDQNFVDEDKVEGSSCTSRAKRLKTEAADSSSNDQIVPNGKFHQTDFETDSSSKREAGVIQPLLPINREMCLP